jgi:hypothetical protein
MILTRILAALRQLHEDNLIIEAKLDKIIKALSETPTKLKVSLGPAVKR